MSDLLHELREPMSGEPLRTYLTSARMGAIVKLIHALWRGENLQWDKRTMRVGKGMNGVMLSSMTQFRPFSNPMQYPWTPYAGSSASAIRIRTGTVNDTFFPTNAASEFTLSGDGTTYFYLEAALTAGRLTSVSIEQGSSVPAQPEPEENLHPTTSYKALFAIDHASGVPDFGSVQQYAWQSLAIVHYLHDITGTAPEFDKTFQTVWLSNAST